MGSRVLSRSFTLSKEEEEDHENENENSVDNSSLGSAMDIDSPHNGTSVQEGNEEERGEEEEETEEEVVMIPMADILNARYNTENVQLRALSQAYTFLIG
jgi:SET domain-containing protein 6